MAGQRNVKTWIDTIIAAVKTKLCTTDTLFDANYCFLSLEPDQQTPPPTDLYATLVVGPQRPDQAVIRGAAAGTITPVNGELGVILWARLAVDQAGRDDLFVTDPTLGALAKWRQVLKSLQLFDPVNGSSDFLLMNPMRLADPGFLTRPRTNRPGWGSVASSFEVDYLADLSS